MTIYSVLPTFLGYYTWTYLWLGEQLHQYTLMKPHCDAGEVKAESVNALFASVALFS